MNIAENETQAVLLAGERLLAALAAEERLARLHNTHKSDRTIFDQWVSMRQNVETLTGEYFTTKDEYLAERALLDHGNQARLRVPETGPAGAR
jgi:hypothetical protein